MRKLEQTVPPRISSFGTCTGARLRLELFLDDSKASQIRARNADNVATPAISIIRATWP